jgi:prepilin signal peptidase PulO-like enzyme (type II secretory pathway)
MWLTVLCGLALGLMLNLGADWLPRRALSLDQAPAPAAAGVGGRVVRWVALLLLSTGLVLCLRQSATVGSDTRLQLLAGVVPALAYCSLLLLIATIDLEHRLVPDVLILAGLILALGFHLLSLLPLPLLRTAEFRHLLGEGAPGLAMAITGAAVGGGLFLLLALARRNALGVGDVKLALLIGMLTGFPWVLQALVLGIVLGGVAAALLLLFRLKGPNHYIPYAPYLAAGAMATLLCGPHIAQWYAGLVVRLAFPAIATASSFRPLAAACRGETACVLGGTALRAPVLRPALLAGFGRVSGLARLPGVGG